MARMSSYLIKNSKKFNYNGQALAPAVRTKQYNQNLV